MFLFQKLLYLLAMRVKLKAGSNIETSSFLTRLTATYKRLICGLSVHMQLTKEIAVLNILYRFPSNGYELVEVEKSLAKNSP